MADIPVLLRQRPDIWVAGLSLATALTGYSYVHKSPLPNGRVYACGGYYSPPSMPGYGLSNDERLKMLRKKLEQEEKDRSPRPNPWEREGLSHAGGRVSGEKTE
jgi:hypothetical protein